MDPLSITVASATLATSVGTLILQVNDFVKQVRDARRDLDSVKRELGSLQTVLEVIAVDASDSNITFPPLLEKQLPGVLANCGLVVSQIEELLQKYIGGGIRQGVRWAVSGKDDVNKLLVTLEAHKSALDMALEMIAMYVEDRDELLHFVLTRSSSIAREIKHEAKQLRNDTSAIIEGTAAIKDDTAHIRATIERWQVQTAELPPDQCFMLNRFFASLTSYTARSEEPFSDRYTEDEFPQEYEEKLVETQVGPADACRIWKPEAAKIDVNSCLTLADHEPTLSNNQPPLHSISRLAARSSLLSTNKKQQLVASKLPLLPDAVDGTKTRVTSDNDSLHNVMKTFETTMESPPKMARLRVPDSKESAPRSPSEGSSTSSGSWGLVSDTYNVLVLGPKGGGKSSFIKALELRAIVNSYCYEPSICRSESGAVSFSSHRMLFRVPTSHRNRKTILSGPGAHVISLRVIEVTGVTGYNSDDTTAIMFDLFLQHSKIDDSFETISAVLIVMSIWDRFPTKEQEQMAKDFTQEVQKQHRRLAPGLPLAFIHTAASNIEWTTPMQHKILRYVDKHRRQDSCSNLSASHFCIDSLPTKTLSSFMTADCIAKILEFVHAKHAIPIENLTRQRGLYAYNNGLPKMIHREGVPTLPISGCYYFQNRPSSLTMSTSTLDEDDWI
jgi:hypothetical protein